MNFKKKNMRGKPIGLPLIFRCVVGGKRNSGNINLFRTNARAHVSATRLMNLLPL